MAARLVDAQAPGLASSVRRLAAVAGSPDRLLTELSLLRLLTAGYRRLDELPADLAATVRTRVGLPVATDDVLAGPRVRDVWTVIGVRDEVTDDRLTVPPDVAARRRPAARRWCSRSRRPASRCRPTC